MKSRLFAVVALALLQGCSDGVMHEIHGFLDTKTDIEGGIFRININPEGRTENEASVVVGSPYEIFFGFRWNEVNKNIDGCIVSIDDVQMIGVDSGLIEKTQPEERAVRWSKNGGDYFVTFYRNKITLNQEDQRLMLNYQIDSCGSFNQKGSIDLLMKYSIEERRIGFWDALMAI